MLSRPKNNKNIDKRSAGLRYLGPRLDIILRPLPTSALPFTLTPLEVRCIIRLRKLQYARKCFLSILAELYIQSCRVEDELTVFTCLTS